MTFQAQWSPCFKNLLIFGEDMDESNVVSLFQTHNYQILSIL